MGIAHTYMAAEMLELKGEALGVKVIVETHGAIGVENKLTKEDIKDAIGVIIVSDQKLNLERFSMKPLIVVSIKEGIRNAENLILKIMRGELPPYMPKENE